MSTYPVPAAPAVIMPSGDRIRQIALRMGLALVFLRFSMLHQLQSYLMGFNMRLLYLVGIPAMLGIVAAAGIPRSLGGRPTYYWLLFTAWLVPATMFSTWKGGSMVYLFDFVRTNLPILFVIAGLAVTWQECKLVMRTIGYAALVNIASARIFESRASFGDRLGIEFGTVNNPNDLAAHLILVLPFLFWMALTSKRTFWRIVVAASLGYGIIVILKTGSRGALLGMAAAMLCLLLLGTARQRLFVVVCLPLALLVSLKFVPETARQRLLAFVGAGVTITTEAQESRQSREYVLRQSIRYTLDFPLFGLGPGQYPIYEGTHNSIVGKHGLWLNAHNSFTQISSECGIPGLLFYLLATGSMFRLLIKTYRQTRGDPAFADIATATGCILMGVTGFCIAITFLSFGYFFYLPALGGLSICIWHAAQEEFRTRAAALQPASVPGAWAGTIPARNKWLAARNSRIGIHPAPAGVLPSIPATIPAGAEPPAAGKTVMNGGRRRRPQIPEGSAEVSADDLLGNGKVVLPVAHDKPPHSGRP